MLKIIITVIIVAIIILGGYSLFKSPAQAPQATEDENISTDQIIPGSQENSPINDMEVTEEKEDSHFVVYTNDGYSPSSLTIQLGDTVIFENQSSVTMWPASALHPTHREYPTTGGCIGSTFDACQGIQPGDDWSFQFDIPGTWRYHDHLAPTLFGSIIVQE